MQRAVTGAPLCAHLLSFLERIEYLCLLAQRTSSTSAGKTAREPGYTSTTFNIYTIANGMLRTETSLHPAQQSTDSAIHMHSCMSLGT